METGRLRPIPVIKKRRRKPSGAIRAAETAPPLRPPPNSCPSLLHNNPYSAWRLPNPAPPISQRLDIGQTFPNPVFPHTVSCRAAFLEFRPHNRPYVGRPLSNFVPCSSRGTLLYAVIFCLQASPSVATSLVGPLGRTPFSPPPLCLAIRIRQTQKRGRRNKCTGLFTKRNAVN